MAQGKKSFVAYADWKEIFDELPNEQAGELIKHIFSYVNDENPNTDSVLIRAVFANIKSTLKRDLDKWESQLEQRRKAGKRSAEIRSTKTNEPSTVVEIRERNPTVNDNVTVNVNVNDIVTDIKRNNIEERKLKFASTLKPFVDYYGKELLKNFYAYWTEPNKSNTKFKQELEKTWSLERRLETWAKNDKTFKPNQNASKQQSTREERNAEYLAKTISALRGQVDSDGTKPNIENGSDDFTTFEIMQ